MAGELFGLNPKNGSEQVARRLDLALEGVPMVARDHTDRNRTSPLAFTGNKFEFRMPGANSAIYLPLTMLIAAMTEGYEEAARMIAETDGGKDRDAALLDVFTTLMREAEQVVFDGDSYSQEWRDEAAQRGLPNAANTAEALEAFNDPDNAAFLERLGIWSKGESSAFYRVKMDEYAKRICIEANTMLEMVHTGIRPAALEHQTSLAERVSALAEAQDAAQERELPQADTLERHLTAATTSLSTFGELIERLDRGLSSVETARDELEEICEEGERGRAAATKLAPAMQTLREVCDELERYIPVDLYPYPTCGDLLYAEW